MAQQPKLTDEETCERTKHIVQGITLPTGVFLPSEDLYYLAGLLTNKSILKLERVSRDAGDRSKLRVSCKIRHHSQEGLLLLQRYFGGALKEGELKITQKDLAPLLETFLELLPLQEKMRICLDLLKLKSIPTGISRRSIYEEMEENFKRRHYYILPDVPEEYEGDYIGGLLDDCLNCFIYPRGEDLTLITTLNFKYPELFGLVSVEGSKPKFIETIRLINDFWCYCREIQAGLKEFLEKSSLGPQGNPEKWSLRNAAPEERV